MSDLSNNSFFRGAVILSAVSVFFCVTASSQEPNNNTATNMTAAKKVSAVKSGPFYTNYKDIKIGTTAKEVRNLLGKAKIDDKDGFYYKISDSEFVQIRIDKKKQVRLMSVSYTEIDADTPKFTDIFGPDAELIANKKGTVYKLVRYPEFGYWVAYTRTSGKSPMVTVTIQKIHR